MSAQDERMYIKVKDEHERLFWGLGEVCVYAFDNKSSKSSTLQLVLQ